MGGRGNRAVVNMDEFGYMRFGFVFVEGGMEQSMSSDKG